MDRHNNLASFSSWGLTSVDLAAPSPGNWRPCGDLGQDPGYHAGGGTSSATAQTSGVAALLRTLHPNWTNTQIKTQILATVDPLPSLNGKMVSGGRLNAGAAVQSLIGDLTDNGFVDFEDLTVLLANWNQNVPAAQGNLVDADTTPVNFEDLTVLLAAWTGPAPAGSPQPAATEATAHRHSPTTQSHTTPAARFDQLTRRAHTPSRRIDPSTKLSPHDAPLRRLQAGAVDRAMGEEAVLERESAFVRRRRR